MRKGTHLRTLNNDITEFAHPLFGLKVICAPSFELVPPLHEGAFCLFFVRWGSTTSVLGLAQCFSKHRVLNSCV